MQIRTTHGSQIRTSTGSKIHTGRSIIHFGSEMAFGTYKKSSGFMDTINADMNGEYDQPQKQPQDQTGTSDLNNVLSEDGKQLYSMLKKSDKRKYQNYYNRLRSRQQWVRYESENGTFTRQKKQGGSQINVAGGSAARKGGTTAKRTAQKTAQGVIRTTEKNIATTTKTVTNVTAGAAAGAATFGAGTVVMAAADAAVTTGKATAKTARKVIQSMQQQTVQSMQEQQAVTAAESRSAAQDEERKKETSQSSMVLVLFAAFVAVMVIISSFTAVGITIKQSQDSQGNQTGQVCTKIAEAAEAELSDADTTVGGYRYKNWYGMDDNWCAMFVSYCADKCGFIEAGIMPKTASVAAMKQWYISHGLFQTVSSGYKPKAGDIIIFGNGMSHTGIVTGYDDETKTVTTIEGNSGRSSTTPYHKGSHVKEHHYPLSYAKIVGYGTPQYPSDDSSQIENQTTVQTGEM